MTSFISRTPLNQIITTGLKTPIVLGPMANAAGGLLAGKVSKAGGLGFLGAGYYSSEKLKEEIGKALEVLNNTPIPSSSSTSIQQSSNNSRQRIHLGVGFLAWRLTLINKGKKPEKGLRSFDQIEKQVLELLDETLRNRPNAIWLSFGDEEEMIGWSWLIRKRDEFLHGNDDNDNVKLFIGIGNENQAKCAIEQCGADVLVVQGNEAGGHGLGSSPPLSAILPFLSNQLKTNKFKLNNPSQTIPPLLAAGGIMNGTNMASAMALGADGVIVGTRMLMTPEATYSDEQKKTLVDAGPTSTLRTMAFDEARNTLGWPEGVDGRGIVNETVNDFLNGKGDGDSRRATYKKAEQEGDTKRIVTWAGTGVGLINKITNAEDIIEEMTRDCQEVINSLSDRFKVYN